MIMYREITSVILFKFCSAPPPAQRMSILGMLRSVPDQVKNNFPGTHFMHMQSFPAETKKTARRKKTASN